MPKILFLVIHRPNRSPCQRFRFEQYLPFLKESGFDYDFSYLIDEKSDKIFYSKGNYFAKAWIVVKSCFKRLRELFKANQYDIIFVQRECFMLGTSFFEKRFSTSKAKMVFDFDDAIWLQNISEANKTLAWLKNPEKTAKIISYADVTIAGNPYLKQFADNFNSNTTIIPTTIDTIEYNKRNIQSKKDKLVIGWSGSVTTIQHFKFALEPLKIIKEKYKNLIEIIVIGDANYKDSELSIQGQAWKKETEIDDLNSFDIGIMPLPNDEWAKGKCGLKGLQYMALEIPTIMSAVGVNTEIIQDGENGFLATTEEEWVEKLSLLIESPALREKLGKAGRKTVVEKYSVEANKDKYLHLFQEMLR